LARVEGLLRVIRENLALLDSKLEECSGEELVGDPFYLNSVLHILQVSSQALIDLASHVIAESGLGVVDRYSAAPEILRERGVLERGEAEVVVDASVVVKWFVPERYYERALKLRDAYLEGGVDLASPSLVLYEVANALRFHRVYRLPPEDVASAVRDVVDLGIIKELTPEGWVRAIKLSVDRGVSVQDAVYGAMALALDGALVTSDEELRGRIGDLVKVTLLSELDL